MTATAGHMDGNKHFGLIREIHAYSQPMPICPTPVIRLFHPHSVSWKRMIPPFDDSGCLPAGVHPATLAEIAARFGVSSELRRVQMESVHWMIEAAVRAGVRRIVLNGSFVTDIIEPNDVDCALLIGPLFPKEAAAEKELLNGLPFLDISLVDQADFDYFVNRFFAVDRIGHEKGLIEVIL